MYIIIQQNQKHLNAVFQMSAIDHIAHQSFLFLPRSQRVGRAAGRQQGCESDKERVGKWKENSKSISENCWSSCSFQVFALNSSTSQQQPQQSQIVSAPLTDVLGPSYPKDKVMQR